MARLALVERPGRPTGDLHRHEAAVGQLDELAIAQPGPVQELAYPQDDIDPRRRGGTGEGVQLPDAQLAGGGREGSRYRGREQLLVLIERDLKVLGGYVRTQRVSPHRAVEPGRVG